MLRKCEVAVAGTAQRGGRSKSGMAAAALLAALVPSAGSGQAARITPATMDVAGVRLGMSADDAAKVAGVRYACERSGGAQSFQQMVRNEVVRRSGKFGWMERGTAIDSLSCKGPNGEDLTVRFAQTPAGSVADVIQFYADGARIDVDAAVKLLAAKYGPPSRGTAGNGNWCGAEGCSPLEPNPRFDVSSSTKFLMIVAKRGQKARAADEAALKAAADRAATPSSKPAL